jgi:hypothetical protein
MIFISGLWNIHGVSRSWPLCATLATMVVLQSPAPAAAAPGFAVSPSVGSVGIRLLEGPTNRENDPRAHTYVIDYLKPGAVIHRKFEVESTAGSTQHVDLYAAGASIDGGEFTLPPDRTADELSGWVSLDHSGVDLRPGGSAVIEASIAVPKTATSGERYAVIWAQCAGPAGARGNIRMVTRVGLRVYLDVGEGGEPASDFQIDGLAAARTADGRPEFLARVRNTGARALDLTGSASLADGPGSLTSGPVPANAGFTLGIGGAGQVTVPFDKRLPDGPWTAQLTLASGLIQHTVSDTVTFPHRAGSAVAVTSGPAGSGGIPAPLFAIVAGLSALLFGLLVLAVRRARRDQRSSD